MGGRWSMQRGLLMYHKEPKQNYRGAGAGVPWASGSPSSKCGHLPHYLPLTQETNSWISEITWDASLGTFRHLPAQRSPVWTPLQALQFSLAMSSFSLHLTILGASMPRCLLWHIPAASFLAGSSLRDIMGLRIHPTPDATPWPYWPLCWIFPRQVSGAQQLQCLGGHVGYTFSLSLLWQIPPLPCTILFSILYTFLKS